GATIVGQNELHRTRSHGYALAISLRRRRCVPRAVAAGDVRLVLPEHVGHDDGDRVGRDGDDGRGDRPGLALVVLAHDHTSASSGAYASATVEAYAQRPATKGANRRPFAVSDTT